MLDMELLTDIILRAGRSAMELAAAQANISIPMTAMGLHFGATLLVSIAGALVASASTYYLFGRGLNTVELAVDQSVPHPVAEDAKGVLDVINRAGAESFRIAVAALPMLRSAGAIDMLTRALASPMAWLGLDPAMVLPAVTKFLGGATAWMGVMAEMMRSGAANAATLNASAGLLLNPFDLPGVAILMSSGRRVAAVWRPAALGACVGIALRTVLHLLLA